MGRKKDAVAGVAEREFSAFRENADLADLAAAFASDGVRGVTALLDVDTLAGRMSADLVPMFEKMLLQGATAGAEVFADGFGIPPIDLEDFDSWAGRAAEAQIGELVRDVTEQQRAAIDDAVSRALREGTSPTAAAREIERTVGLTQRGAAGFSSWVDKLVADSDASAAQIQRMIDGEYARRVRSRAETIARTEIVDASTEAQLEVWRAAIHDGTLSSTRYAMQWVTAGNPCPICEALGDSDPVEIGGNFESDDGDQLDGPPAHPNCECGLQLVKVYDSRGRRRIMWTDNLRSSSRPTLAGLRSIPRRSSPK
jgi:hypothetical protein